MPINSTLKNYIQDSIVLLTHTSPLKLEILNNTIKKNPNEAKEALVDLLNYVNDRPSSFNQERLNEEGLILLNNIK